MKKLIFACSAAIVANTVVAELMNMTPEVRAVRMKEFGGDIPDRRKQQGEIVIVNAQAAIADGVITGGINRFVEDIHVGVRFEKGTFDVMKPDLRGTATLFVIADKNLPMTLVAPEAKWAVVNVEKLKSDKTAFFEARVRKALYRVMGELCGASGTKYDGCIFGAMTKAEDLDQIATAQMPIEYYERFAKYLPGIGIVPYRLVRYSKACQQGWAPAPTNEYQKAVWDKVHEIPSNPIKIEFDPKKDK